MCVGFSDRIDVTIFGKLQTSSKIFSILKTSRYHQFSVPHHTFTMKSTVAFLVALIALFSTSAEASARSHSRSRAVRRSSDSTTTMLPIETPSNVFGQEIESDMPSRSHSRSRTIRRKQPSSESDNYSLGDSQSFTVPSGVHHDTSDELLASHSRSRSPRVNAQLSAKNVSHTTYFDAHSEMITLEPPLAATSSQSSFVTPRRKLSLV